MQERHAQHSGPDERGDGAGPRSGEQPTEAERDAERRDRGEWEEAVERDEVAVVQEVGRIPLGRREVGGEQPTDVGPDESAELVPCALPVALRGVRVAGLVAEAVVAAVCRDPADDTTFERHRTRGRERDLQRPVGPEAAVREHPMETDGHPDGGHEVEHHGEDRVAQVDDVSPEERHRDPESHDRTDDERGRDDPSDEQAAGRGDRRCVGGERRGRRTRARRSGRFRYRCLDHGATNPTPRSADPVSGEREAPRTLRPDRPEVPSGRSAPPDQTRSMTMAGAMPPPAHIVTRPNWPSVRSSSSSTVPMSMAPVAPIG